MIIERYLTGLPEGCHLNEMQELLVPHIGTSDNVIVAAPTASGKSQAITMFGHRHLVEGKRVVYIGIMRALAQEKADDWAEDGHPWQTRPKTVISGDYKMDTAKQREIDAAQIICITPESLASRLRHPNSPKNTWLHEVGIIVVDECHLISADSRGTNLEAGLMELTTELPHVQIVGLSATMPNVHSIGEWLTTLNGKNTVVIESDYRPVPLTKHYIPIERRDRAGANVERINNIVEVTKDKEDQQFLICVWQKMFGNQIESDLNTCGVKAAFHNANHSKESRKDLESRFKSADIRALVSTSTLFTGVNLPARNVIITAVEAAMQDIPVYELQQAMGRAGRPRYDTEGDVYIYLPAHKYDYHRNRIEQGEPIISKMYHLRWLAMHFLGAQYLGRINNFDDFVRWFDRTLTAQQNRYTEEMKRQLLRSVLDDMSQRNMIMYDDYTKEFRLAYRGKVAAQMYINPYHLSDMVVNITKLIAMTNPTDVDIAVALGSCCDYVDHSMNAMEQRDIPTAIAGRVGLPKFFQKSCAVIWYRIRGEQVPVSLINTNYKVYEDMPRLHVAVSRINRESEHWRGITPEQLDIMFTRVILKCNAQNAEFGLRKFTKNERKKLNELGVYSYRDAQLNLSSVLKVMDYARCVELNLIRAGTRPPTSDDDTSGVTRGFVAANKTFVGKRGFKRG